MPVPIATELLGSWSDPGGLEMQCMEIRDTFEDAIRKLNKTSKQHCDKNTWLLGEIYI